MDADTGRILEVLKSCGIQAQIGVTTPYITGAPSSDPIVVQILAALAAAGIVLIGSHTVSITETANAHDVSDATNP